MKSDFLIAVTQLAAERNLPREVVISAIEAALVSVYKKEGEAAGQNLSVKILPSTGEVKVATLKTVVKDVEDPELEITPKEAAKIQKGASLGDVIEIETTAYFAGRIAAQTAKQVVMQRLRETERGGPEAGAPASHRGHREDRSRDASFRDGTHRAISRRPAAQSPTAGG